MAETDATADHINPYHWGKPRCGGHYVDRWSDLRTVYEGTYRGADGFEKSVALECFENAKDSAVHSVFKDQLLLIHGRWIQPFQIMKTAMHGWVIAREQTSGLTIADLQAGLAPGADTTYPMVAYLVHELLAAWVFLEKLKLNPHGAVSPEVLELTHTGHLKVGGYGYNRIAAAAADQNDRVDLAQIISDLLAISKSTENQTEQHEVSWHVYDMAPLVADLKTNTSKTFRDLYKSFIQNIDAKLLDRGKQVLSQWVGSQSHSEESVAQPTEPLHVLSGQWLNTVDLTQHLASVDAAPDPDTRLRNLLIHGLTAAATMQEDSVRFCIATLASLDDTIAHQTQHILEVMQMWLRGDLNELALSADDTAGRDVVSLWAKSFIGRFYVMRNDFVKAYETLNYIYTALAEFANERTVHSVWGHLIQPSALRDQSLAWMAMIDVLVFNAEEGMGHLSAIIDKHARASQIWWLLETQTLLGFSLHHQGETQRAMALFLHIEQLSEEHGQVAFSRYARSAREALQKSKPMCLFGDQALWINVGT